VATKELTGLKLVRANSLGYKGEFVAKGQTITEETHPFMWAKYDVSMTYQTLFAPIIGAKAQVPTGKPSIHGKPKSKQSTGGANPKKS